MVLTPLYVQLQRRRSLRGFGESFKVEKQTDAANVLKVGSEWNCPIQQVTLAEGLKDRMPQGFAMICVCVLQ